ncbi:conserved hypothetical protein [Candidatus Desulfarcum epimagneticum]|uniref:Uncharacterized protein n=1 Tax=uncultured Desulfobacteraceae bacterium TaxID=218296 RepID=A0A484HHD5_9BACT|nr:conserved hypothetical protein [uncultured Desulfobacteraceae bacterium]
MTDGPGKTPEMLREEEEKKQAIFDSMSEKRRKHILKRGYEEWDPFLAPKDPIDIRKDKTRRTSRTLIREFLQSRTFDDYSNAYGQGAMDICLGMMSGDDRFRGMYEFACWHHELVKREGHE